MTEVGYAQAPAVAQEAVPRPCLGCGAPMAAAADAGLHADATLTCRFCGRSETMPADAAAQDRYLRLRLMQVRRTREGMEAPLKAYDMMRQSWAFALVIFGVQGGWQLWNAFSTVGKVPIDSTVYGMLGAAGVVGAIVGNFGMMRAFRKLIRPLQQARPPATPGLAARCRSCGGDLPAVRSTHAICGFCGANNFLDNAMARDVNALLTAEQEEYKLRATGGKPADNTLYQRPARAFYVWGATGAAAVFVTGVLLVLVLV
jgi:hypothetical protein